MHIMTVYHLAVGVVHQAPPHLTVDPFNRIPSSIGIMNVDLSFGIADSIAIRRVSLKAAET